MEAEKSIFFVGIGGIGMSALARYFKSKNWAVSGSDLVESPISKSLIKEGIKVKIGHRKANIAADLNLVVYNRAIPANNPELVAAKRGRMRTIPYAEILGELTEKYATIAVTGSHGKSTTTALAGLVLVKAGFDPTVLVGTNLKEFGGKNVRIGKGPHLVLEADDFGGAFLYYSPAIAIVTNIDREHLDFYGGFSQLKNAFVRFLARTKHGGTLILNRDDKNLYFLRNRIKALAKKNKLKLVWYSLRDPNIKKIKTILKIPGAHNAQNALAAYKLGVTLKIPEKNILAALGSYHGSWRRMEYRGKYKNAPVYDDYAHHPTEIKATLKGFRERYPDARLICVFQPHQAKRLARLFKEFTMAFDDADTTVTLPLYKVPGRDEKTFQNRDSRALSRAIQKQSAQKTVFYLDNPKKLKATLAKLVSGSSVLIMMGAGDIVNYTDSLIS